MTRWGLAILALVIGTSLPAQAQVIDTLFVSATSADCSTASSCASFQAGTSPALTYTVSGTFVATLQFEGTADGQTWAAVNVVNVATTANVTSATAGGVFSFANSGFLLVRVRCSAYSSGTARISATRGWATARLFAPSVSGLSFTNGTTLADTSGSGKLLLTGTTPMIQFGGTTASFPAFKQSAARMQLRFADDSAYAAIDVGTMTTQAGGLAINGAGDALFLSNVKLIMTAAPSAPSACGTSPAVTASNGTAAFVVTGGTGGTATGCTITLPAATNGWVCGVINITQTAAHRADRATVQTASTTTSATWEYVQPSTGAAIAFTPSDVFRGICLAY